MTTLFPIESTEPASPQAQGDHARQYLRLDAEADGEVPALPAATLIRGRASEALDLLPAESVRTVVTSPPYWSLRDYDIGIRSDGTTRWATTWRASSLTFAGSGAC